MDVAYWCHNVLNPTMFNTVEWKCRMCLSGALVGCFHHLPVYYLVTYAICLLKTLVRNSQFWRTNWTTWSAKCFFFIRELKPALNQIQSARTEAVTLNVYFICKHPFYVIYAWDFNNFQHFNLAMMTWNVRCLLFLSLISLFKCHLVALSWSFGSGCQILAALALAVDHFSWIHRRFLFS